MHPWIQLILLQVRDQLRKATTLRVSGTAHQNHQRHMSLGEVGVGGENSAVYIDDHLVM